MVVVEADVLVAIAHHEIVGMEQHVVGGYLRDDFLAEGYALGFIFDDCAWLALLSEEDGVAAQFFCAYMDFYLVAHEGLGIAHKLDKVIDEMLAHPLLRGEGDEALAQRVEHFVLAVCRLPCLYICIFRKVQTLQKIFRPKYPPRAEADDEGEDERHGEAP